METRAEQTDLLKTRFNELNLSLEFLRKLSIKKLKEMLKKLTNKEDMISIKASLLIKRLIEIKKSHELH